MKTSTKITKALLIACCALFAQCGNHEHGAAIDTAQANQKESDSSLDQDLQESGRETLTALSNRGNQA